MIALIDADIVAYRCAATCKEGDGVEVALLRTDKLMREILEKVGATAYRAFLSGSDNFRKVINPDYKANRKDMIPPQYLQDCREYLVTEWKAKIADGQEADDELGIAQIYKYAEEGGILAPTIICSIDKDLHMIPGRHFNWVKDEFSSYDCQEADKFFWKQLLIGDKADNIFGVDGLGPVKSSKLIDPLETDQDCLEVVLDKYNNDIQRFAMNAACLWIKRHEESEWHKDLDLILNDDLQQEVDRISACTISLRGDI